MKIFKIEQNRNNPYSQMNDEEFVFRDTMIGYDNKYFSDFNFKERKLIRDFVSYRAYYEEKRRWVNVTDDLYLDYEIKEWIVKIRDNLDDGDGICYPKDKRIELRRQNSKRDMKLVLLHEMIHAKESKFNEYIRQYLSIYLMDKLKSKNNSDLNKFLIKECHVTTYVPPAHSILFLLKSLDLDLRLKKSFGTIFGYSKTFEEEKAKLEYYKKEKEIKD